MPTDIFCANQNKAIATVLKLQSHGITEEQIISLNNFLESNLKRDNCAMK
jgi:hypothetical protein